MREDVWLIIWGVSLAFTVQILYDALGMWNPSSKIYLGAMTAFLLAMILIIAKPKKDKTESDKDKRKT